MEDKKVKILPFNEETKLAHVVQEVLLKDHRPRMQRNSSIRPRYPVRRQGPPRIVEHDGLL